MSDNVVPLRPQALKRRISITDSPRPGEYIVGVHYSDGRYVFCGTFATLPEAMDRALDRAAELGGIAVWDMSRIAPEDVPTGGDAA